MVTNEIPWGVTGGVYSKGMWKIMPGMSLKLFDFSAFLRGDPQLSVFVDGQSIGKSIYCGSFNGLSK